MHQPQPPQARTPWFLRPSRYGLTLANGVTAIRLVLVPFIASDLVNGKYESAFWMTLVAGMSDAIDGFIARRSGHPSVLGAWLDPIADKILILTLFGLLTWAGHLPLWLMALALARDVAIVVAVAVFSGLARTSLRMKPLFISKVTTACQLVLLLVTLADLGFAAGWDGLRLLLTLAAAALTVASWIAYFFEGLRVMRAAQSAQGA